MAKGDGGPHATRKILILAANPLDTTPLRLDTEAREIDEALQRAPHRDRFVLEQRWAVRFKDLSRALLAERPQIVHFSGHGEADGLALVDEDGETHLVGADALSSLFASFAGEVECVVLNACYTETQAEGIGRHVRYVVGSPRELGDEAAIAFAVGFYDALGAGRSIEEAHALGCSALDALDVPAHLMPVLGRNEQVRSRRGGGRAHVRRRLVVALLLLLAPLLVLVLLALSPKASDVDARFKVSELSFVVTDERAARLLNSVDATFITLSRFERLTLEGGRLEVADGLDAESGEPTGWRAANAEGVAAVVVPTDPFSNLTFEAVKLNWVEITSGAKAVLAWSEKEPNSLNVTLDRAATGVISAGETLAFSCTNCKLEGSAESPGSQSLFFRLTAGERGGGQVARFRGRPDSTVIALGLAPDTTLKEQGIKVGDPLSFTRREEGRTVSTILEANIRFTDFENRVVEERAGTFVEIGGLENAVIKTIGVKEGIEVTMAGRVGKLSTGVGGNMESKLPSVLAWLYARQTLAIIACIVVGVAAFLLTVFELRKFFREGL